MNHDAQVMVVGQRVPASSREEALLQFAKGVFNRLFDMSQGKEDSAADVPLLRVEVSSTVKLSCALIVYKRCTHVLAKRVCRADCGLDQHI